MRHIPPQHLLQCKRRLGAHYCLAEVTPEIGSRLKVALQQIIREEIGTTILRNGHETFYPLRQEEVVGIKQGDPAPLGFPETFVTSRRRASTTRAPHWDDAPVFLGCSHDDFPS